MSLECGEVVYYDVDFCNGQGTLSGFEGGVGRSNRRGFEKYSSTLL